MSSTAAATMLSECPHHPTASLGVAVPSSRKQAVRGSEGSKLPSLKTSVPASDGRARSGRAMLASPASKARAPVGSKLKNSGRMTTRSPASKRKAAGSREQSHCHRAESPLSTAGMSETAISSTVAATVTSEVLYSPTASCGVAAPSNSSQVDVGRESRPATEQHVVDLSDQNLLEIPQVLLLRAHDVTHLDLSDNPQLQLSASVAKFVNLQVLDLSCTGVLEIPDELMQLKHLTSLTIGHSKLQFLPDSIGSLQSLKSLEITCISLQCLPDSIRNLQSLTSLEITGCKFECLPDSIGNLQSLTSLQIEESSLQYLPDSIGNLQSLTSLTIGQSKLQFLPDSIGSLRSLTSLTIGQSKLRFSSDSIGIRQLHKSLPFWQSTVQLITDSMRSRESLTSHRSNDSGLECLPDSIGNLQSLTSLTIGQSKLRFSSDSIESFFRDRINESGLECLPNSIGNLQSLTSLTIGQSKLQFLPDSIGSLRSLTSLRINGSSLECLPDSMGNLQSLTSLSIDDSSLEYLPDSIGSLQSLTSLTIQQSKLKFLPDSIGSLQSLTTLTVENSGLSSYPMVTLKLKKLNKLDFSNSSFSEMQNSISKLPMELSSNTSLCVLKMGGNPMVRPPLGICSQGIDAVRTYLTALSLGVTEICPRTISMLGDTEAGKTSLVRSIREGKPQMTDEEDRTRVMDQTRVYHPDDAILIINDFGGHPIYQTVLAVFLPPEGVGIVVYDMSKPLPDQTVAVDQWMTTAFAKSPALKLIIVGSHLDMVSPEEEDSKKSEMRTFVKTKLSATVRELNKHISAIEDDKPENKGKISMSALESRRNALQKSLSLVQENECPLVFVSCRTGVGIQELRNLVFSMVGPPSEFPPHWAEVMDKIVTPDSKELCCASYLTANEAMSIYQRVASRVHTTEPLKLDDKECEIILKYLMQISRILWNSSHDTLKDCIFHRISHVVDVFKAVLYHDPLHMSQFLKADVNLYFRGYLREDMLEHFLQDMSDSAKAVDVKVFIDLLTQFNLIACVKEQPGKRLFVVPSLLKDTAVVATYGVHEASLHAEINFPGKLLPLSLFETLTAAILREVDRLVVQNATCSKDGVLYKADDVEVVCQQARSSNDGEYSKLLLHSSTPVSNVRRLWKHTWPAICGLKKHILHTWTGACYRAYFHCPGCRLKGIANANVFEFYFELSTEDTHQDRTAPQCGVCQLTIPRALISVCEPDTLSEKDFKDVEHFFKVQGGSIGSAGRILVVEPEELQKNIPKLVENMSDVDVIIGILYSKKVLSVYQKEELQACKVRHRQVGLLLDMLEQKSSVCIGTFVQALRDTNQHNLVDLLQYTLAEDEG